MANPAPIDPVMTDHDLLGKLKQTATALFNARVLPNYIENASTALGLMLKGRELGLTPIVSCQVLYPVNGKFEIMGTALQSMLQSNGMTIRIVEWTDAVCTLAMKRKLPNGDTVEEKYSYTWDEAQKAGAGTKQTYTKHRRDMLYWRALSRGSRRLGADLVGGVYLQGEIEIDARNVRDVTPGDDDAAIPFQSATVSGIDVEGATRAATAEAQRPDAERAAPLADGAAEQIAVLRGEADPRPRRKPGVAIDPPPGIDADDAPQPPDDFDAEPEDETGGDDLHLQF